MVLKWAPWFVGAHALFLPPWLQLALLSYAATNNNSNSTVPNITAQTVLDLHRLVVSRELPGLLAQADQADQAAAQLEWRVNRTQLQWLQWIRQHQQDKQQPFAKSLVSVLPSASDFVVPF